VLGDLLRKARKKLGLNQTEVASLIGVSQPVIHCWERGKSTPTADRWDKVAAVYGVPFHKIGRAVAEDTKAKRAVAVEAGKEPPA
jgi:transcriptional regulator with XRE-family HTH domain